MKFTERPFVFKASPEVIKRAAELRKHTTVAEDALWKKINNKQLYGLRFKRQHPIGKFIVDFYCVKAFLIIELDGGIHSKTEVSERDEGRQYELEQMGLKVLRFTNGEVLNDVEKVLISIRCVLTVPSK